MTEIVSGSRLDGECSTRALQAALELSMMNISGSVMDQQAFSAYGGYRAGSKSLNVTQCVSVPSSEHVAEIVGKQGMF